MTRNFQLHHPNRPSFARKKKRKNSDEKFSTVSSEHTQLVYIFLSLFTSIPRVVYIDKEKKEKEKKKKNKLVTRNFQLSYPNRASFEKKKKEKKAKKQFSDEKFSAVLS